MENRKDENGKAKIVTYKVYNFQGKNSVKSVQKLQ